MPAPAVSPRPSRAVFYLHGFASSPKSTKVGYFRERLREHGIEVHCPDFNRPDFSSLTMTRMLEQLGAELARIDGTRGDADGPVALVGSSLGWDTRDSRSRAIPGPGRSARAAGAGRHVRKARSSSAATRTDRRV